MRQSLHMCAVIVAGIITCLTSVPSFADEIGFCQMTMQVQDTSERYLAELGRHNYVTPTSYLELLSALKSLLETKRQANAAARKRYNVGLEKLAGSAEQVAGMQQELVAMQPQLVATVAEVEDLMAKIAHEKKVGSALCQL